MKISILTATFNSLSSIRQLEESLRGQTDLDFEWIVADGGSSDGTLEYLNSLQGMDLKVIEGPDFGIYDALNKAIQSSSCEYYVVVGSDDWFYPNAVSLYKSVILDSPSADLIVFPVKYADVKLKPKSRWPWLYGQFAYITMHSVGLLVRKKLHEKSGLYSRKYPIAADQLFILSAVRNGAIIQVGDEVVGVHGDDGVSGVDKAGVITEFYRVQIDVGFNKYLQTVLCSLRLLKSLIKV